MKQLPVEGHVEIFVDDEWHPAAIIDLLSEQFTAERLDDLRLSYHFYKEKGITWRQLGVVDDA